MMPLDLTRARQGRPGTAPSEATDPAPQFVWTSRATAPVREPVTSYAHGVRLVSERPGGWVTISFADERRGFFQALGTYAALTVETGDDGDNGLGWAWGAEPRDTRPAVVGPESGWLVRERSEILTVGDALALFEVWWATGGGALTVAPGYYRRPMVE